MKIIKVCIHHGKLDITRVVRAGKKDDVQLYKCRECLRRFHANHYQNHKHEYYEKHKSYKKENREKINEWKRKYYFKYRDRDLPKKAASDKKLYHRSRNAMDDRYIKMLIAKHSRIPYEMIPESIIEFKRILLMMKKTIKDETMKKLENKNEDKKY